MRRNKKGLLKKIILGVLALGGVLAIANVISNRDEDLRTKHLTYSVGALSSETGKYEYSESTLYTKNAFDCKGLKIELDFDSDIEYQVFFYDEDDNFVSASERTNSGQTFEDLECHAKARIVIYPNWNDVEDVDDQVVTIFNKITFTSQIKVLVAKDQKVKETTKAE